MSWKTERRCPTFPVLQLSDLINGKKDLKISLPCPLLHKLALNVLQVAREVSKGQQV